MKKFSTIISLALLVMLAACNSTDDNLRAMIPDDALGVIEINVPSLGEKSGIIKDGNITVPADLKKVIDDSDPTIQGDIIDNIKAMGIDVTTPSYIFFSPGIYKAVALMPLSDDDDTRKVVEKLTASKMTEIEGVDFATHLDYAYVIDDDVLLIGRYNNPVEPKVAANAAAAILGKKRPGIFANEEIAERVNTDTCDIKAYLDVKGMSTMIKSNARFNTMFGNIPAMDLITESDIKAMVVDVKFDVENEDQQIANINTEFLFKENGLYSRLYDSVISSTVAADSTNVMKLIPGELTTYVGMKLNGDALAQLPQMEIISESLPLGGINIKDIMAGINGDVIFGFAQTINDNYNFAIAVKTKNPDLIISQLVEFGSKYGQDKMILNGEYVYDYDSRGIAFGKTADAFYLRCVDFESAYNADEKLINKSFATQRQR